LHVCREVEVECAVAIGGEVALGAVQYFSEYRHLASIERRPSAQDCWSCRRDVNGAAAFCTYTVTMDKNMVRCGRGISTLTWVKLTDLLSSDCVQALRQFSEAGEMEEGASLLR
jgi:hypothetical protein